VYTNNIETERRGADRLSVDRHVEAPSIYSTFFGEKQWTQTFIGFGANILDLGERTVI
jgi:hypothetical protein